MDITFHIFPWKMGIQQSLSCVPHLMVDFGWSTYFNSDTKKDLNIDSVVLINWEMKLRK